MSHLCKSCAPLAISQQTTVSQLTAPNKPLSNRPTYDNTEHHHKHPQTITSQPATKDQYSQLAFATISHNQQSLSLSHGKGSQLLWHQSQCDSQPRSHKSPSTTSQINNITANYFGTNHNITPLPLSHKSKYRKTMSTIHKEIYCKEMLLVTRKC